MKLKNYLFFLLLIVIYIQNIEAQDIHFSQFHLSPLTQNPANTGGYQEVIRVAGIYRNQWYSVSPHPFNTACLSIEKSMKPAQYLLPGNKAVNQNYLAAGIMIYYDQSGVGRLNITSLMGSIAYHIFINDKNKFSVGAQFGGIQKKINYSKLYFDNQYSNGGFDNTLNSKETFDGNKTAYGDINAGFTFNHSFKNPKWKGYLGFAVFHLLTPKETFLKSTDNKLNRRFNIYLAADYIINKKVSVRPMMQLLMQTKAQETNMGALLSYKFGKKNNVLFAGLQGRVSVANKNFDALFPSVGLKINKVRVGLSYDINLSKLREASQYQGGPELAVIYTTGKPTIKQLERVRPCDIF